VVRVHSPPPDSNDGKQGVYWIAAVVESAAVVATSLSFWKVPVLSLPSRAFLASPSPCGYHRLPSNVISGQFGENSRWVLIAGPVAPTPRRTHFPSQEHCCRNSLFALVTMLHRARLALRLNVYPGIGRLWIFADIAIVEFYPVSKVPQNARNGLTRFHAPCCSRHHKGLLRKRRAWAWIRW
jgi:hypothetical protein